LPSRLGEFDRSPRTTAAHSRSLTIRAGVEHDHCDRCLRHVLGGQRGTYDRHECHLEKKVAYEKLAALIEHIVNPVNNVVAMPGA
jgi:hypothetical protein